MSYCMMTLEMLTACWFQESTRTNALYAYIAQNKKQDWAQLLSGILVWCSQCTLHKLDDLGVKKGHTPNQDSFVSVLCAYKGPTKKPRTKIAHSSCQGSWFDSQWVSKDTPQTKIHFHRSVQSWFLVSWFDHCMRTVRVLPCNQWCAVSITTVSVQ